MQMQFHKSSVGPRTRFPMRIPSVSQRPLVFFVLLLFVLSFCHAKEKIVEVVGTGECADCAQSNFKTSQAFSGLRVTIDCKSENGDFKTRGTGELDEEGKFKVSLPEGIVDEDGNLKEECYAQLHSASSSSSPTPCPAYDGLESSKIVFNTKTNEKHTFRVSKNLKFSPLTCASAFFFKHPPLLPQLPPWTHPKYKLPPFKSYGHHHHHPFPFPPKIFPHPKPPVPIYKPKPPVPIILPPPVPIYKLKPPVPIVLPPPVPIYKPKPPVPKVLPPPVPIYKPKPPVPKVLPPPVPIYKPKPPVPKVLPPPVPIYKPKPPVPKVLPPPVPIYKPKPPVPKVLPPPVPIYKPKPPVPKLPPIPKKPCPPPHPKLPPIPKFPPPHPTLPPIPKKPCPPPHPKLPPIHKIPPKYFHHHHPKFGKWPHQPPTFPSHP